MGHQSWKPTQGRAFGWLARDVLEKEREGEEMHGTKGQERTNSQEPCTAWSHYSFTLGAWWMMGVWLLQTQAWDNTCIFSLSYLGSTSARQNQLLGQSLLVSNVDVNFPFMQGLSITFQTNRTQENWVRLIPLIVGILCKAVASSWKCVEVWIFTLLYLTVEWSRWDCGWFVTS